MPRNCPFCLPLAYRSDTSSLSPWRNSTILNYRTRAGRERRYTIGSFPDWKTAPARAEAGELKKRIDRGEDPLAESEAERAAKTVADLIERFEDEHLPKQRSSKRANYRALIGLYIEPELKHRKVADVNFEDIDSLHRKVTKRAPYCSNGNCVSPLSPPVWTTR